MSKELDKLIEQVLAENIKVNLTLNVLHEITPGFIDSDKFNGGALKHKFPYGVGNRSDVELDPDTKNARQQQAVDRADLIEAVAQEQIQSIEFPEDATSLRQAQSQKFRKLWKGRATKLEGKKPPTRSEVKKVLKERGLYSDYKSRKAKY